MALGLYRRHRQACEAGHATEFRSSEFDERKKGWKRCACLIFASGSLARTFKRKCTGKTNWDDARAVAASWEKAGSWDGEVIIPEPLPESTSPSRVTIERASKSFLNELQQTAAFSTCKKYRLLLKKFSEFAEQRGYVMLDQWEPSDVREFRSSWAMSQQTAARCLALLKVFFEYCVANEWLTRNPARLIKNPRGRDAIERPQRLPFTDEELNRMYEACHQYGNTWRYKWTGDDISDFISLSIYTGLRISDVVLFQVDRLLPSGEIILRTTKAGTPVCTWVPQWLQERIRARARVHGSFIFGEHTTQDLDVMTDIWRRKL